MSIAEHGVAQQAAARSRPNLRPLALPTEHGGWGFLLEPMILALVVAPSWGGLLLGAAAFAAFLTRQPLRLALQDLVRGRSYPRTRWCQAFALGYLTLGAVFLTAAIHVSGSALFIPLGLVAPLAIVQVLYDAQNRNRQLLPEISGAVAMSSIAAAIAIAGGMRIVPALTLSAIVIARLVPTIVYVRTLLQRAHGLTANPWPSHVLHAAAVVLTIAIAPLLAVAVMLILFARAIHGLSHEPPHARTLGWREIAFGGLTVALTAAGFLL